ncbi:putative T6SS immunity periplasmic lipoprotein [Cronobacter turicensis]|uniref:putative T6SS immunity periplasmic lipoprotein n=1 Tax=Cronobacter turicensis TaxID=413502 RepID=UPI0020CA96BD|nr:putative T6SS immunity periplasmic lipoprotein [Cronobacter turicensis]
MKPLLIVSLSSLLAGCVWSGADRPVFSETANVTIQGNNICISLPDAAKNDVVTYYAFSDDNGLFTETHKMLPAWKTCLPNIAYRRGERYEVWITLMAASGELRKYAAEFTAP